MHNGCYNYLIIFNTNSGRYECEWELGQKECDDVETDNAIEEKNVMPIPKRPSKIEPAAMEIQQKKIQIVTNLRRERPAVPADKIPKIGHLSNSKQKTINKSTQK